MAKESGYDIEAMNRAVAVAKGARSFSESNLLQQLAMAKKAEEDAQAHLQHFRAEHRSMASELEASIQKCAELEDAVKRHKHDIETRDQDIHTLQKANRTLINAAVEMGKEVKAKIIVQEELEKTQSELAKVQEELKQARGCSATPPPSGEDDTKSSGEGLHEPEPLSEPTTGRDWVLWGSLAIVLTVVLGFVLVQLMHPSLLPSLSCPVPSNHTCPPCKVCPKIQLTRKEVDVARNHSCQSEVDVIKDECKRNATYLEEELRDANAVLEECREDQNNTLAKLASCEEHREGANSTFSETKEELAKCEELQNSTALALAELQGTLVVKNETISWGQAYVNYMSDALLAGYECITSVVERMSPYISPFTPILKMLRENMGK